MLTESCLSEDVVAGFLKKKNMYFEAIFREKNAIHYNQGSFFSAISGGFSSVVPTEGQHRPAVDRPLALGEQRCRCFVPEGCCPHTAASGACQRGLESGGLGRAWVPDTECSNESFSQGQQWPHTELPTHIRPYS